MYPIKPDNLNTQMWNTYMIDVVYGLQRFVNLGFCVVATLLFFSGLCCLAICFKFPKVEKWGNHCNFFRRLIQTCSAPANVLVACILMLEIFIAYTTQGPTSSDTQECHWGWHSAPCLDHSGYTLSKGVGAQVTLVDNQYDQLLRWFLRIDFATCCIGSLLQKADFYHTTHWKRWTDISLV